MCLKLLSTHLDVQARDQAPLTGGWSRWHEQVAVTIINNGICIRNNKWNDDMVLYCGCLEMRAMHMQTRDLKWRSYFGRRSSPETLKIGIYAKNQFSSSIFVKLRFGPPTHVKLRSGPWNFQNFLLVPKIFLYYWEGLHKSESPNSAPNTQKLHFITKL